MILIKLQSIKINSMLIHKNKASLMLDVKVSVQWVKNPFWEEERVTDTHVVAPVSFVSVTVLRGPQVKTLRKGEKKIRSK